MGAVASKFGHRLTNWVRPSVISLEIDDEHVARIMSAPSPESELLKIYHARQALAERESKSKSN